MAKDEAIRNQKVFIRLDNLITVLNEYRRAVQATSKTAQDMAKANNDSLSPITAHVRRAAFEFVLDTLQLPREGN